jgi:hypothetical protein
VTRFDPWNVSARIEHTKKFNVIWIVRRRPGGLLRAKMPHVNCGVGHLSSRQLR